MSHLSAGAQTNLGINRGVNLIFSISAIILLGVRAFTLLYKDCVVTEKFYKI